MNNKNEKSRRLETALRDAYHHPPRVRPDEQWRKGVMAEVRDAAAKPERANGPIFVPPVFFRLAPLLAGASVAVFAMGWSAMGSLYNELAVTVLTNLPRTAELYLFGL
ncbi:MAG: hypothetical protein V1789_05725 [PVC group bacterium]